MKVSTQGPCSHSDLYKNLNIWHLVKYTPRLPDILGCLRSVLIFLTSIIFIYAVAYDSSSMWIVTMALASGNSRLQNTTWFIWKDNSGRFQQHETIERHTAHSIVSWSNPKQWIHVVVHTSDLIINEVYIISIITRENGKLKTYNPIYCIMNDRENMLYLTHTLDKIYLTGIL